MRDSERRTVRPYDGVSNVQTIFDSFTLKIGEEVCRSGATILISEQIFNDNSIQIQLADSHETYLRFVEELLSATQRLEISKDDIVLIAVCTSPFRRLAEVIFSISLSDIEEMQHRKTIAGRLGHRPEVMSTAFHGFTLAINLCLSRTIPRRPLRPSLKGTWLARATFRVHTNIGDSGFCIEPLNEEIRERFNLEPGVIRYVELSDPTNPAINDEDMSLYVDEDLLAQLTISPNTPGALVIQRQLFLDVITAIIYRSSIELANKGEDLKTSMISGSVLDRILDRAARDDNGVVDENNKESFFWMVVKHPNKFVAEIESWMSSGDLGTRKLNKDMCSLARGSD